MNTPLKNIKRWPTWVKVLMTVFALLGSTYLEYGLILRTDLMTSSHLHRQENDLRQAFEVQSYNSSNLAAYQTELLHLKKHFEQLNPHLVSKNSLPGMLGGISKLGKTCNLMFESLAPLPEISHDFYTELPMTIVVLGQYHELMTFLKQARFLRPMLTWHDFVIEHAASQAHLDDRLLTMKITAKAYRYTA